MYQKAFLFYLRVVNFLFRRYLKYKSIFANKKSLSILISKQKGWQQSLQTGFANTKHKITFDNFSKENICKYDLVIPLNLDDSYFLNEHKDKIENNPIPIASKEVIDLCDDKVRFNQFMIANGFSDYIPAVDISNTLPFIVKKRIDVFGHNSHIVSTHEDRRHLAHTINDPEYFTQALVTGNKEYATHIYFNQGKILYALNIEYIFDQDIAIKGPDKPLARTVCSNQYLDLFSDILNTIDYQGICCINYKIENNKPLILEINPRVGGSFCEFIYTLVDRI